MLYLDFPPDLPWSSSLDPQTLLSDYTPIISKCDMRLSGWRGRSLPIGGRLLLVNSVLTAMIAHAMAAGLLPPGVVEAIDKRRHAFFWDGGESLQWRPM
jgi:hypothetical protein